MGTPTPEIYFVLHSCSLDRVLPIFSISSDSRPQSARSLPCTRPARHSGSWLLFLMLGAVQHGPRSKHLEWSSQPAAEDRSARCGVGMDPSASAEAAETGAQTDGGSARDPERDPLHDAFGRRLAHVAEGFPALADGLLEIGRAQG